MNADPYANMRLAAWREALRVLAGQLVGLCLMASMGAWIWGRSVGLGALIGGGIGLLANVYLAIALLGKPVSQRRAEGVLLSWLIRVVMIFSLLWIALRARVAPPLAMIAGLMIVYFAHWVTVSFWLRGRR